VAITRAAGAFSCNIEPLQPEAMQSGGSNVSLADSAAGPGSLLVHGTIYVLASMADSQLLPPTQPAKGFVRAAGTAFQLPDGSPFYFQVPFAVLAVGVHQHHQARRHETLQRKEQQDTMHIVQQRSCSRTSIWVAAELAGLAALQGTNIYNLLMHSEYSEESIRGTLLEQWTNGIKVQGRPFITLPPNLHIPPASVGQLFALPVAQSV
jgi:hypothetical protein